MTVSLTAAALRKLADGFGLNSLKYNEIIAAAEKSAFLAGELNVFGSADKWRFISDSKAGIFTDSFNQIISFDPSWSESPNAFATTLAHELGHALLPGAAQGAS